MMIDYCRPALKVGTTAMDIEYVEVATSNLTIKDEFIKEEFLEEDDDVSTKFANDRTLNLY